LVGNLIAAITALIGDATGIALSTLVRPHSQAQRRFCGRRSDCVDGLAVFGLLDGPAPVSYAALG
jgi:hypothetical protein